MSEEKQKLESIASEVRKQFGDDMAITISTRRKIGKTPDFVMVYQEVGKKVLQGDIQPSACKILFYLIVTLDFDNFTGIDLKTISENINMPLPTIKKGMAELKDIGILLAIKDMTDRRRNIYRFNPLVAWKGKVNNRAKVLKETDHRQYKMFQESTE